MAFAKSIGEGDEMAEFITFLFLSSKDSPPKNSLFKIDEDLEIEYFIFNGENDKQNVRLIEKIVGEFSRFTNPLVHRGYFLMKPIKYPTKSLYENINVKFS